MKEKSNGGNGSNTLSIVALVFSILISPVGLIIGVVARGKEGANTLNSLAIIFGMIGTFFWVFGVFWYMWYYISIETWLGVI